MLSGGVKVSAQAARPVPQRASSIAILRQAQDEGVKTAESGGLSGYDAGKKINGRKRHIVTDTLGLMLFALVHGADADM